MRHTTGDTSRESRNCGAFRIANKSFAGVNSNTHGEIAMAYIERKRKMERNRGRERERERVRMKCEKIEEKDGREECKACVVESR